MNWTSKKGGLVTSCHNKLHDGVSGLDGKYPMHTHVRNEPLIHTGHTVKIGKRLLDGLPQPRNPPVATIYSERKVDLLIQDLFQKGTH